MLQDFISLIYPRNCVACGNSLYKHEDQVCNYCYVNLPKTYFHLQSNNLVKNLFYGRVNIEQAGSFYLFHKKGSIQKILHDIKYKNNKDLAVLVGNWYAKDLLRDAFIKQSACIIPVPLHPKKYKQRGFNQSEEFARGLAEALSIPLNTTLLTRSAYTSTQTLKNKFERWENVEDKFVITETEEFKHQSIILVDDVITTGATIEACCHALKQIEGIKISVLSIAYAAI